MDFEKYISIYNDEKGRHLKPNKGCFEIPFELDINKDKNYRLHTVGETGLFYKWRNELNYPQQYREITDALDSVHACNAQFCIDFSSKAPQKYAKRIYKKEICNPIVLAYIPLQNPESIWKAGVFLHGENVMVEKSGYLRMRIDISFVSESKSPFDTVLNPDETHIIDFPTGTFDFTCVEKTFEIKDKIVSSFGIWIEGVNYSGKLYVESPFLINSGYNLISDFSVPVSDRDNFNWTGQNLSKKEWPEFRVKLNGNTVFEGEIFERCHRHSEWEIDLPKKYLQSKNTLSYELISDYHDPLPYNIYSSGILEQEGALLSVIATSYAGVKGKNAFCLVKTAEDNLTVDIICKSKNISAENSITFEKKGLHGIKIMCKDYCTDALFLLKCRNTVKECVIPCIIEKEDDNILLGTGDMVYVNHNLTESEEYICWYLSNQVGNFITLRPTYRWSGIRTIDEETISMLKRVLSELEMKYVLLMDGRELTGLCCNPTDDMLQSEYYLGRQNHERDGKAYYWGVQDRNLSISQLQFYDMMTYERMEKEPLSQFPPEEYSYRADGLYSAVEPDYPKDVTELEERTVTRLSQWKTGPRHTGPSYMQKYLAKAGYDFVGAETMYSNHEMLLGIMRGVQKCYDMPGFGVHHALQWSTSPHDSEAKYRRFYIALWLSYMLGATDINTEEGLWHLEEFFSTCNRFSAPCKKYTQIHRDFTKYILTHSRKGTFYTPLALIHGRCDGTLGFGEGNTWGISDLGYCDAEESWKTANVFYPCAKINDCFYLHPCPEDKPVGFYSGTPMGNVDIIPIEALNKVSGEYKALAFMGYNLADEADLKALLNFVKSGGTLILTHAHLTKTTNIYDIKNNNLSFDDTLLSFAQGKPIFVKDMVSKTEIEICTNLSEGYEILEKTASGMPLIVKYDMGEGSVVLFNTNAYPGNPAIKSLYKKYLGSIMSRITMEEKVWAIADDSVEFCVYDDCGIKTLYFLAVDWYNSPEDIRYATLKAGKYEYKVEIPFGTMIKCVSNGEKSVWTCDPNGEILKLSNNKIIVQGTGISEFVIAEDGILKKVSVDFSKEVIREILF